MGVSKIRLRSLALLDGKIRHEEGVRLATLAATVPADQAIVEVGSYRGKSTCYLATGAAAGPGAHVYAIDLWTIGGQLGHTGKPNISAPYADPETYDVFLQQLDRAGVSNRVTPMVSSSQDAARDWEQPVGLLFIDAEHSYQACLADIEAWAHKVVPGGWIAFHDYKSHFPGVMRAVQERILASPEWADVQIDQSLLTARCVR